MSDASKHLSQARHQGFESNASCFTVWGCFSILIALSMVFTEFTSIFLFLAIPFSYFDAFLERKFN